MTNDRDIQVRLGEYGEYAEVAIKADADPSTITFESLTAAATAAGVAVTGAVAERLQTVAASFQRQPRAFSKIIATAKDPVHGKDGYLRWEAAFARVTQPPARRDTSCSGARPVGGFKAVNHRAGFRYVDVKTGEHVATIIQPTPGNEGIDVCGQPIKAHPGKPCDVRVDRTLAVNEDGKVIAEREGTLVFDHNILSVQEVLTVSGCVDFTTGNIKVNGSVDVKEHVRAMFTINATGDVTVGGIVEAATIICNGNFHCRRGVTAKGRGKIVTGGDANVGYLNDACGTIGAQLQLRREAIDCELLVKGNLQAETATVIGGMIEVQGESVIGTLGSRAAKPTVILPRGSLRVIHVIHQGVTLRLPVPNNSRVLTEAILRDDVQGEVQLQQMNDQWCFVTPQKQVLPLADVANIQNRRAA